MIIVHWNWGHALPCSPMQSHAEISGYNMGSVGTRTGDRGIGIEKMFVDNMGQKQARRFRLKVFYLYVKV